VTVRDQCRLPRAHSAKGYALNPSSQRCPNPRNALTPLFPLDTTILSVSPLFPLDTKTRQGRGYALPRLTASGPYRIPYCTARIFVSSLPFSITCALYCRKHGEGVHNSIVTSHIITCRRADIWSAAACRRSCDLPTGNIQTSVSEKWESTDLWIARKRDQPRAIGVRLAVQNPRDISHFVP